MSGHPQQGGYDDGYGHQQQYPAGDAYYQEEHHGQGYENENYDYDQQQQQGHHGGEGYYDES